MIVLRGAFSEKLVPLQVDSDITMLLLIDILLLQLLCTQAIFPVYSITETTAYFNLALIDTIFDTKTTTETYIEDSLLVEGVVTKATERPVIKRLTKQLVLERISEDRDVIITDEEGEIKNDNKPTIEDESHGFHGGLFYTILVATPVPNTQKPLPSTTKSKVLPSDDELEEENEMLYNREYPDAFARGFTIFVATVPPETSTTEKPLDIITTTTAKTRINKTNNSVVQSTTENEKLSSDDEEDDDEEDDDESKHEKTVCNHGQSTMKSLIRFRGRFFNTLPSAKDIDDGDEKNKKIVDAVTRIKDLNKRLILTNTDASNNFFLFGKWPSFRGVSGNSFKYMKDHFKISKDSAMYNRRKERFREYSKKRPWYFGM